MRAAAKTRREQILAAAMRLFSRQGFDGTTTRAIARSAGVNEAIIFRHFTSKEKLYWAVVSEQMRQRGPAERLKQTLRSSRSGARQPMAEAAENLLLRDEHDAALTRLLLFSALRPGERTQKFFRREIGESLNLLSEYIREGVERGTLRKIDPVIGARAFMGMVVYHNLLHELLGGAGHQNYDPRELGRQLANIWLNGVSAGTAPHPRPGASGKREPGVARNGRGGAAQPAANRAITA